MIFEVSRLQKWLKNCKKPVGKAFFGVWRLLNCTTRRYLHGFARLPDGFGLYTLKVAT